MPAFTANYKHEVKHAWERQIGETGKAYHGFCYYRDMGIKRSIRKTRDVMGYKSVTILARWSRDNDWVWRASEYDAHLEREAMKEAVELVKSAKLREVLVGSLLMQKAEERIRELHALEITPQLLVAVAKAGSELTRLGLDVYTQASRTEITGPDGQVLPMTPEYRVVFTDTPDEITEEE